MKHVGILVRSIFDNDSVIPRQRVRYRMLFGVEYGLRGMWRFYFVMSRPFHSVRVLSFIKDEFAPFSATVALWKEAVVSEIGKNRNLKTEYKKTILYAGFDRASERFEF